MVSTSDRTSELKAFDDTKAGVKGLVDASLTKIQRIFHSREIVIDYSKHVMALGLTLFEILSEALGLNPNHLKDKNCAEGLLLHYPACTEPELTLGGSKHTDGTFITILLQDQVGGLRDLYENQWVDVRPMHGALVISVGYLLQLITNDTFISVAHRVRAKNVGPRTSVASFFRSDGNSKVFGPIKEFLSVENPKVYKEVDIKDYVRYYYSE